MRVRFAPSPTGYLHVGGARTALFNWLLARREGGTFVLRIEDTDRARSTEAHTRAIVDGLRWLGLDWDEGPHFQSEGLERHRASALRLLRDGRAYRDFTPPEELTALREEDPAAARARLRARADALEAGEAERRAEAGAPHAVRFRVPEGETAWNDRVHGETLFRNGEIEDLVLLRTDGTPTYNLAVVSDDAHMRIDLVIRGDDHLSNTPKQILLHRALGHPVPAFAHVPMILGPDGKRLSKRHGATAVGDYAGRGILPEAMVNFLALLGWSPGGDLEVMTREELVARFSLERVLRKSAVFDFAKLEWLNGQHLNRVAPEALLERVLGELGDTREAADVRLAEDREGFLGFLGLLRDRARTLGEIALQLRPYLVDAPEVDPDAAGKHWWKDPEAARARLEALRVRLGASPWEPGALEDALRALAAELGVGAGKLIHPLRVALTGQAISPGIFDVLVFLGRERSLRRIAAAEERIADGETNDSGSLTERPGRH